MRWRELEIEAVACTAFVPECYLDYPVQIDLLNLGYDLACQWLLEPWQRRRLLLLSMLALRLTGKADKGKCRVGEEAEIKGARSGQHEGKNPVFVQTDALYRSPLEKLIQLTYKKRNPQSIKSDRHTSILNAMVGSCNQE
jgi:hypothetical protein